MVPAQPGGIVVAFRLDHRVLGHNPISASLLRYFPFADYSSGIAEYTVNHCPPSLLSGWPQHRSFSKTKFHSNVAT
jgi:hypothetical protein